MKKGKIIFLLFSKKESLIGQNLPERNKKMTVGEQIKKSRKAAGVTGSDLAARVGLSAGSISKIETGVLVPSSEQVVAIYRALKDRAILMAYYRNDPVYKEAAPWRFPNLNNLQHDVAAILGWYAAEIREVIPRIEELVACLAIMGFQNDPEFKAIIRRTMKEITDVTRAGEQVEMKMLAAEICTEVDLDEIHVEQQRDCEARGLHKPEKEVAA